MSANGSNKRMIVFMVIALLAMTVLIPVAGNASRSGRVNTAVGLTGLSAYWLANGRTTPGLLAAAGAAIAWDNVADRDDYLYFGYGRPRHYYYGRDWDRDRYYYPRYYGWGRDRDDRFFGWGRDRDRFSHGRDRGDRGHRRR